MIPVYGTYRSIKDAYENPTWGNIGMAGLSALSDVGLALGVGATGRAALAGMKASRAVNAGIKASKAAKTASQWNKAQKAISNGLRAGNESTTAVYNTMPMIAGNTMIKYQMPNIRKEIK